MGKNTPRIAAALFAAVLLAAAPGAWAEAEADHDDRRLAQLERLVLTQSRQIAELQHAQGNTWLNERRAEQVKALIREVLCDAETRASLLDGHLRAGWDDGFFLSDDQGKFLMKIKGMIQTRYTLSKQDDNAAVGGDDSAAGFENTRIRFGFLGHVIDPTWQYVIWTGHGANGGSLLLDAAITKKFADGWSVTAGQFKVPLWREWLVSETCQQFVERSNLTAAFAGSYTQGVKVGVKRDQWNAVVSFNDGLGGINATWNTADVEYAFSARGEVLLAGDWSQYRHFESWVGEDPMFVLGGAVHWEQGEYGTTATVGAPLTQQVDILRWTFDGSLELGGVNLFAAVLGSHEDAETFQVDRFGLLVQGGYFVTEKLELIARYEWGEDDLNGSQNLSIATIGANYFMHQHAARLTFDLGYAFNPVSATFASNGTGFRQDAPAADGQLVARAQMQLLF